jgi:hypothetical protein
VVATFALGASAMPASAKPVTSNSGLCTIIEDSDNPAKQVIARLFGCGSPP